MNSEEDLSKYLTSVNDVTVRETEWVIPHWIPKGGITLLVGDGGIGKTNLWCYLISRISGGLPTMLDDPEYERPVPPGAAGTLDYKNQVFLESGQNRTCLYFSKEDSTSRRLRDTLEMYGADIENIHTIDIEHLHGLHYTSPSLEKMIEEQRPAICIFDPVQAFYPNGASMTSRQQSREALDHLIRLGQQYNTAFLLVCHTNKRKTDDWRERISGSADLPDIARSVIFTSYTEIKPHHEIHYISNEKNSYAPLQHTVLYRIDNKTGVTYAGFSMKNFADYVHDEPFEEKIGKPKTQKERCSDTILSLLKEQKKMPIKELDEALLAIGFGAKTVRNAKEDLEAEKLILRQCLSTPDPETGKKNIKWIIRLAQTADFNPDTSAE